MALWSLTKAEIVALIRSNVQASAFSATTYWKTAEVERWLNQAMEEVADQACFNEVAETTNVVGGTAEYALPDDILAITSVDIKNSDGDFGPVHMLNWPEKDAIVGETPGGTDPSEYGVIYLDKLYLYGTPDYSSTNGLRIRGRGRPQVLATDAQVAELKAPYIDAVVCRVSEIAYRKKWNPEKISYYHAGFLRGIARIRASLKRVRGTKNRVRRDVEFGNYDMDTGGEKR